ncbi:MAG: DUF721 domain-containing protein [Acidobacteriota bacterium]|nr:DUF721 domain-containing protein [Acidobacteriota bacterium]
MERASRIIGKLNVPERPLTPEQVVLSAWPRAVGKRLAQNTRAAKLVRTRLVVEVEDAVWQRNLFTLSWQILANLVKHVGPGMVEDLEFRVVPRRREPQRAVASMPVFADDADGIADPVLRQIYKSARRRETA